MIGMSLVHTCSLGFRKVGGNIPLLLIKPYLESGDEDMKSDSGRYGS